MRSPLSGLAMLAGVIGLLGCGERVEPAYTFARLDVPGSASTIAFGINGQGQIVGWYRDSVEDRVRGFLLRDGGFTTVDYPGAALTMLNGIGPDGDIVGTYRRAGEPDVSYHGFRLTAAGQFVDVSVAGHPYSVAVRILPDGTILGCYHDADSTMRGVTFAREGPVALDVPATMSNGGTPDGRRVVGLVWEPRRAFVVDDGVVSFFDAPGSTRTEAWDVSPSGVIVGLFEDSTSTAHGFLHQGEEFTTIDYPGAASTMIFGIGPAGDLVGAASDSIGRTHGFVARPSGRPRE